MHSAYVRGMNFRFSIPTDPRGDDRAADRTTFLWTAAFLLAGLVVTILSTATEIQRYDQDASIAKYIIFEGTGYLFFLALFPVIGWVVTLATPGQQPWRQVLPVHFAASLALAAVHISLFVAARKILMPVFYGEPYVFTDNLPREFIYEYRKSALAYCIVVVAITFGRELQQQRRELAAIRDEARKSQRLTLKCGGRTIFVNAADIVWVKSASNYVEVMAGGAPHLARATLASVERQLSDAGAQAIRVHRSWIVNADQIVKTEPTGEGDVKIEMKDGTIVPGSRRYRDRLPSAA